MKKALVEMRCLIIHADDFGKSPLFNKGIVEGINKGRVTSVSVLVNGRHVQPRLLAGRKVSVGLHFELKSGRDPKKALEQQIRKFQRLFGKLPSHIDGHLGAHFKPESRQHVMEVAKRYGLPIRSAEPEQREVFQKEGIFTPTHFVSSLGKTKEQVIEELSRIPDGVTEWMVHPGYYDPRARTSLNREREKELQILFSKELSQLIRRERIKLVDFKQTRFSPGRKN